MTILLVSPFFHPEAISTGRYNTALAQGLVAAGQHVDVIASHPLYPDWRPSFSDAQLPGMRISRGGAWVRYPRRPVFRRLVLEIWFTLYATVASQRRSNTQRVLLILPPSLFAIALRGLIFRRTKLIGIVHDLQGVHARSGLLQRMIRAVEARAFRGCDRLIFLSHSMARRAIAEYRLDVERCTVHYPFLTLPPSPAGSADRLASVLPDGVTHVVYSGALGDKQDPDRLIATMRTLSMQLPEIRCHVFSAGPHFERLREEALARAVSEPAFHPLVAEDEIAELYARSTVQLLPQAAGTGEGSLPSKLPNLLAAGVPVFAICDADSEVVELLQRAGRAAGSHAAGFDDAALPELLRALLATSGKEDRAARIARQRPLVEAMFGVERLVRDLIDA